MRRGPVRSCRAAAARRKPHRDVYKRQGLGYEELRQVNPRIIYAAVSGFGSYGPYHLRPGYDILAQAMGGMMAITGPAGGGPTRAGSALGDILGGLHVTIGILAAVNARAITGQGQRVDVSLTVSYTHLDVYKRQSLGSMSLLI